MAKDDDLGFIPNDNDDLGFVPSQSSPVDESPEGIDQTTAFLGGLGQGATFGLSDEILGGGEALYDIATKEDKKLEDLKALYQQYRDMNRQDLKAMEEAHPGTFLAGNLSSALIPGAGAAKVLQGGNKVLQALKAGAAVGGLTGFGSSEADLTEGDLLGVAKDTAAGTILGAGFGAGAGKLGQKLEQRAAAKATQKATQSDMEIIRDIQRARELGKQGESIIGIEAGKKAEQKVISAAKNIEDSIFKQLDNNFDKKLELFKNRPNETINLSQLYQETMADIDDAVRSLEIIDPKEIDNLKLAVQKRFYEKLPQKVTNAAKKTTTELVDPRTGQLVKKEIQTIQKQLPQDFELQQTGTKTSQKDILRPTPESQMAEDMFPGSGQILDKIGQVNSEQEMYDAIKSGVLRGDMTLEEAANFVRDFQRSAFKIGQKDPVRAAIMKKSAAKASDLIEQVVPETKPLNQSSTKGYDLLDELGIAPSDKGELQEKTASFVKKLDEPYNPEQRIKESKVFDKLKETLGEDQAFKLQQQAKQSSQDYLLGKRTRTGQGLTLPSQIVGTAKDLTVQAANVLGRVERKLGAPIKNSSQAVQKFLYNADSPSLEGVASRLEQSDTAVSKELANQLRSVLNTTDDRKRNAILFSINQNPAYRQLVKEMTGLEDSKE